MRIIPKKSNINSTLWLNFTLFDLIAIVVLGFIGFAIIMSNIIGKWVIAAVYSVFAVILFFDFDGVRFYSEILYLLRWLFVPKLYKRSEDKNTKKIDVLMPYKNINEDGIIEYNDGYFGRVLEIGQTEFRLLNEYTQSARIMAIENALKLLSLEQIAQLVKIDRPLILDDWIKDIDVKLDSCKDVNTSSCIDVKKALLASRKEQFELLNNVTKQYIPSLYLVIYDDSLDNLNFTTGAMQESIGKSELDCKILAAKETALFLKYCYTRNFDERGIENYDVEHYVDYIKPEKIKFKLTSYEIDGVAAANIAVADYPLMVSNAWGAGLFNIDNTKVCLTIKPVDNENAVKRIDKVVSELASRKTDVKASKIMNSETHLETMAALLQSLQNESESFYDCTLTVTAFDNSRSKDLSAFRRKICQSIKTGGFRISLMRARQLEAFTSANISRRSTLKTFERGINSNTLAAIYPFVNTHIVEPHGIALGYNNSPIIFDLWKRDNEHTNSSAMIIGKPGGGKSYFTKMFLANLYADDTRIFILDPENEYTKLVNSLGGSVIDVGTATVGRINPFHIYKTLRYYDDDNSEIDFQAHLRFLESFFKIILPGISQDSLETLNNLVQEVYARKNINEFTHCDRLQPKDFPTFDDLLTLVQKKIKAAAVPSDNLLRVEMYVQKFAGGGRYSNLWNGCSTLHAESKITSFNFQSLLANKNNVVANGQMLLVVRFLEQEISNIRNENYAKNTAVHPVVVAEEGHVFVDPSYPVALDFMYNMVKRIRKYFGSFVFITQNIKDLNSNPSVLSKTSAIINNCQYSMIFPLMPADMLDLVELYRASGEINETEQNEIVNNGRGKAFFITAPRERTSINVVASEYVEGLFLDTKSAV